MSLKVINLGLLSIYSLIGVTNGLVIVLERKA